MKSHKSVGPLVFTEDGSEIRVQYSNRGEPFRDGVELGLSSDVWTRGGSIQVLLNEEDVIALRDKLSEFLNND